MDWTFYWFMLPVCVCVASIAMFSGISGAALLMPVFLFGFPLMGAPAMSTVSAIGMSLFLETSGFGTGVYRYVRSRLVDWKTVSTLAIVTVPLGIMGAMLARLAPVYLLRGMYGMVMVGLAVVLWRHRSSSDLDIALHGSTRVVTTAAGAEYRYPVPRLSGQRVASGAGAFLAGLISTGVGEATLPGLIRRHRFPVPVAAATTTVIVATTVVAAAATHLWELSRNGGWGAIPWDLVTWAAPGAICGAFIGTHLQGRIPERTSQRFFSILFLAIGALFVASIV